MGAFRSTRWVPVNAIPLRTGEPQRAKEGAHRSTGDYVPLVEPLFQAADSGEREIVTSALTMLEVLVVPYKTGDHASSEDTKHSSLAAVGFA